MLNIEKKSSRKIVILGAGPTGLGAAYRLKELGHEAFVVLEARGSAGGLASSETSANGFIYDIGGHVLFSHFRYFDELFDRMLGDEYQELQREAWVWMMDRFL
ncbi:MAG: NAD(P)-binding protein, partial [Acidobacteriota bacterium]